METTVASWTTKKCANNLFWTYPNESRMMISSPSFWSRDTPLWLTAIMEQSWHDSLTPWEREKSSFYQNLNSLRNKRTLMRKHFYEVRFLLGCHFVVDIDDSQWPGDFPRLWKDQEMCFQFGWRSLCREFFSLGILNGEHSYKKSCLLAVSGTSKTNQLRL